jgi:hypothetical protein
MKRSIAINSWATSGRVAVKRSEQTFSGVNWLIAPSGQAAILVEKEYGILRIGWMLSLHLFVQRPNAKFGQVLSKHGTLASSKKSW